MSHDGEHIDLSSPNSHDDFSVNKTAIQRRRGTMEQMLLITSEFQSSLREITANEPKS
jgi:hypothetical protein